MKIIINIVLGSLIIGYFFGCINFSYIVSRIKGFDIRHYGSGNAGASNVVIVIGKKAGLFVALFDIFKAFLAYKLAQYLFPEAFLDGISCAGMIAGVGAVLGHIFPFYLGFKGGKGLACYGGTILAIDVRLFLVLFVVALFIAVITDYICFAPITMSFIAPLTVGVVYHAWIPAGILGIAGVALLYKHAQNIARIRSGSELRFHFLWRRQDESERFGIVDDGKEIFNREVTK
ncbi:MAG: glycerol-3-phosphate 1-O-acyltransferase PlsY [Lachnospiraceae bacterium]|nr:glycerol-3-phosphate 1-O-acyltransferase PlsY [Lachnospiraceae bacterium]